MGYDIIIFLSNIHPYFKLPLYPLLKIPTFSTQKKKIFPPTFSSKILHSTLAALSSENIFPPRTNTEKNEEQRKLGKKRVVYK